jgi:transposase InsO family protein
LRAIPLRGNKIRALLVGAWLRLQQGDSSITCRQFCRTLGVSERAFRRWRNDTAIRPDDGEPVKPVKPERNNPTPKPSPIRRGRFDFDVTLPDTQFAADTTDLNVFGIKLKLIASQDVGGRDNDLLEDVIVDDRESAAHVEQVLNQSLAGLEGAQAITDQGTPYLAEATRKPLEDIQVDHAPQREGDPLGKATIERAFGTVKTIAAPLFDLTGRLADKCPSLREPGFAKAFSQLPFRQV